MENYIEIIYNSPVIFKCTETFEYTDLIDIIIDDIPCQLFYGIRKGYWWFNIQDRDIFEDDNFQSNYCYINMCQCNNNRIFKEFNKDVDITPEIIEKLVNVILEFLETLKFSKYEGSFLTQKSVQKETFQKMVFHNYMEKDTKQIDVCPVCLEQTKTKTPCNHTLCIPCWQKIKQENKKCPLCRDSIGFFRSSYDSSNEDE